MTDTTTPIVSDPALAADQALVDRPSSTVSAFVAAAITEHRRNDGLSQLLADLGVAEDPAEADRTWARDALGVY